MEHIYYSQNLRTLKENLSPKVIPVNVYIFNWEQKLMRNILDNLFRTVLP